MALGALCQITEQSRIKDGTSSHLPVPLFPAEDATIFVYCSPTCGPFSHSISAHPWPPASDTCTQRLLKVTGFPPSPPRPLFQTSLLGEDQPECSGCPCLSPHHSEQISSFPTAGPAPQACGLCVRRGRGCKSESRPPHPTWLGKGAGVAAEVTLLW